MALKMLYVFYLIWSRQQHFEVGHIVISILLMRKLRQLSNLVKGYTVTAKDKI